MPELAELFTPFKIRNTIIRNRIVQSAHITGYVENGLPSDRHVRYYEARAKGGVGLIITEAVAISPLTDVKPEIACRGWADGFTRRARKITDAIHAHGAKAIMQMAHGGSVMSGYYTWLHSEAPSGIPSVAGLGGEVPSVLTVEEIRTLVTQHVAMALKARDATLVMPLPIRYISANPYEMDHLTLAVQTAALKSKGVRRIGDCEVKRATPGKVVIRDVFTEKDEELEADTLVLSYWRKAETRLYDELQCRIPMVRKIGDALSPRRCINAIYEGHKVAMEI